LKTLIIYESYHHMNIEKVAAAIAEAMSATLIKVEDIQPEELADYDLIGFGSGIYGYKRHQTLFELIEKIPPNGQESVRFFDCRQLMGEASYTSKRSLWKKAVQSSASSPASASLPVC
jgi:flavodoxin